MSVAYKDVTEMRVIHDTGERKKKNIGLVSHVLKEALYNEHQQHSIPLSKAYHPHTIIRPSACTSVMLKDAPMATGRGKFVAQLVPHDT